MSAPRLTFGFSFSLDRPAAEVADLVKLAEDAGFQNAWFPDHYFLRDVYVTMALAALRTSRIKLGPAVTSPLLRHPALLASATATIEELCPGRSIFGIGPGGFEFGSNLGMPIKRPLGVVREAVGILRQLFSGEAAAVEGTHFSVHNARVPFARAAPPIYIAARGQKMMQLAVEVGDGLLTHGTTHAFLQQTTDWVREGLAARDGNPRDFQLGIMSPVFVDRISAGTRDKLRNEVLFVAGGSYAQDLLPLLGHSPEQMAPLRAAMRAGDIPLARSLVTDAMLDSFSINGPLDRCLETLDRMAGMGVKHLVVMTGGGLSASDIAGTIKTMSQHVIPHFAAEAG
jgi:5,10-methylenetetrahydromethanopterin reductase